MNYEALVPVMRELALEAGDVIMEIYNSDDFEVKVKSDESPVTAADEAADAVISAGLRKTFPDVMLVTEEQSASHSAKGDTFLIVDPLDGTTNYVHQLPGYCVSLALRRDDALLVGIIFDPISNECFSAVSGQGAYLNGQRIRVSDCEETQQALLAVSLPPQVDRGAPEIDCFLDMLVSCQAVRRIGSAALNLAYLAAGRLDGYWATSTKIWDVAAGVLLVQEAGGEVSGSRGGPFCLESPGLLAASTSKLNQRLTALVAVAACD